MEREEARVWMASRGGFKEGKREGKALAVGGSRAGHAPCTEEDDNKGEGGGLGWLVRAGGKRKVGCSKRKELGPSEFTGFFPISELGKERRKRKGKREKKEREVLQL